MAHDFSLNSGERQVATTYDAIRADHRYRYEWAETFIEEKTFGLDVFCGNGYGCKLLGQKRSIIGIDGSEEAIALANRHFRTENCLFSYAVYPFLLPKRAFDFVVSLESVEHVEEGFQFLMMLTDSLKPGGILIFSTPCEENLPLAGTGNHFHFKHYSLGETLELPEQLNLEILRWAGQDCYYVENGKQGGLLPEVDMMLKNEVSGQFTIVAARKR